MYGFCNHRLVYSAVLEASSNYKWSYLCWLKNLPCDDSKGIVGVEIDWVRLFSRLAFRKKEIEWWVEWFSVFGVLLDDWSYGDCVMMSVVISRMESLDLV